MEAPEVSRLTAALPSVLAGYLRDWDRALRAANHPDTTRYKTCWPASNSRATSLSTAGHGDAKRQ